MAYEREKQVAIASVCEAVTLCEQVRHTLRGDAIEKPDLSPVTIADFGAQAVICRAIATAFPDDAIIAEEDAALLRQPTMRERLEQVTAVVRAIVPDATALAVTNWIDQGKGSASRYWTLDPIDGTKGFLRGDQYAIALALIESGEVKLGVMACPALPVTTNQSEPAQGVLFVAVRGQGTTVTSLQSGSCESVHVDSAKDTSYQCLIESVETRHGNLALQRKVAVEVGLTAPVLRMDSLAKYGVVARGQAALYLRLPWAELPDYRENIWDHAAGVIVLEEAGGRVTDIDGKLLDFSGNIKLTNNRGIVASNGTLHEQVLAVLRKLNSE